MVNYYHKLKGGRGMTFGEQLSAYRVKAKLTLRDFAAKVGYDASNISKVERDRINPPAGGIILRKWGLALGLADGSNELKNFVSDGLAVRIKKATLSDDSLDELMPAFFRAVNNKQIDPSTYDQLRELLKKHL